MTYPAEQTFVCSFSNEDNERAYGWRTDRGRRY